MKRITGVLTVLIICAALLLLPISALADYEGSCGENVNYYYNSETKVLTLTGEGAMNDYTMSGNGRSPFYQTAVIRNNCERIEVGEGITHVGNYIFFYLTHVTECVLPSTLETIGDGAFQTCSGMVTCAIPAGVTSIGENAFNACRAMTSVEIPAGVTVLPKNSFNNCSALTEINIPGTVTTVGQSAFGGCTGAQTIILGEGVETIGLTAFSSSQITEVAIPASVTSLSPDAFNGSNNFAAFHVSADNAAYADVGGVLYNKEHTVLLKCPAGFSGAYEIDAACETVSSNAFEYCAQLTGVTIPESVTEIGDNGFMGSGLTEITIPESVTSLGNGVLQGCESLVTATINANVPALSQYCINGCPSLETVVLGPAIQGYGNGAFSYDTSLTSVTVPENLTEIPEACFQGCSALTSFEFPATVETIGMSAFADCVALGNVTLPEALTTLSTSAFNHCMGFTQITIPAGVTRIEGQLFGRCQNMTEIWIMGEISFVGGNAFGNCPALTAVHFNCPPMSSSNIGWGVFNQTPNVEIHYPNVYPDWDRVRPFDNNNAYNPYYGNYVEDQVAADVDFVRTELRDRATEDGKRDLRFVFRLTPMEGVTVNRRYVDFTNTSTGDTFRLRCYKNFSGDVDGSVIFTAVVTGIEEGAFETVFTAQAFLDMSGDWTGTGYSNTASASVSGLMNDGE